MVFSTFTEEMLMFKCWTPGWNELDDIRGKMIEFLAEIRGEIRCIPKKKNDGVHKVENGLKKRGI